MAGTEVGRSRGVHQAIALSSRTVLLEVVGEVVGRGDVEVQVARSLRDQRRACLVQERQRSLPITITRHAVDFVDPLAS